MIYLVCVGVPLVIIALVVVFVVAPAMNKPERRRNPFPDEREHTGFGDIRRSLEAAHDAPWPPAQPPVVTLHGAAHRQYPLTSPAAPAPPGAEQGTAAAAGGSRAPASPPPLPDPAYATAHPGCWPLGWLEDDQFVTDWAARALAETEALVRASYYKPLDGA